MVIIRSTISADRGHKCPIKTYKMPLLSISTSQVRSYLKPLIYTVSLFYFCPCTAIGVIKYIVIQEIPNKLLL